MSIETTYPHIEKFGSEPARLERLPRIRVAQIAADYLAYGWSADEMCRQHSYLTHAEAHAAMAYYFDHQEEIEREIETECREADEAWLKSSGSPLRARLRARGVK